MKLTFEVGDLAINVANFLLRIEPELAGVRGRLSNEGENFRPVIAARQDPCRSRRRRPLRKLCKISNQRLLRFGRLRLCLKPGFLIFQLLDLVFEGFSRRIRRPAFGPLQQLAPGIDGADLEFTRCFAFDAD